MSKIQSAFAAALPTGGTGTEIPGVGQSANNALGYMVWAVLVVGVLALIREGGKMALAHRNRESYDGSGIGLAIIGVIVALAATGIITGVTGVA